MVTREKTEHQRQQIVGAANQLFYQKGYNLCSFSDIAAASKIPRGNLNYYFKTKNDVLIAVMQCRIDDMHKMLASWDEEFATPLLRLQRYGEMAYNIRDDIVHYGCPMGTISLELGKSQHDLQLLTRAHFNVSIEWLTKQFTVMGYSETAEELALHFKVMMQGIATMGYIYHDKDLIQRESVLLSNWLVSLDSN